MMVTLAGHIALVCFFCLLAAVSAGKYASGKYYQYADVPGWGEYEFGYHRGNEYHNIGRNEKAKKWNFKTQVKWQDKKGGYGHHLWDYNHGSHDKHKWHDEGMYGKGYGDIGSGTSGHATFKSLGYSGYRPVADYASSYTIKSNKKGKRYKSRTHQTVPVPTPHQEDETYVLEYAEPIPAVADHDEYQYQPDHYDDHHHHQDDHYQHDADDLGAFAASGLADFHVGMPEEIRVPATVKKPKRKPYLTYH